MIEALVGGAILGGLALARLVKSAFGESAEDAFAREMRRIEAEARRTRREIDRLEAEAAKALHDEAVRQQLSKRR